MGARPSQPDSLADKLNTKFRPFLIFKDQDVRGLRNFSLTGQETDVHQVDEEYIREAHRILGEHNIQAEPSAAAGLALYMQHWERKLIDPKKKVIIVNTGKGLYEEEDMLVTAA